MLKAVIIGADGIRPEEFIGKKERFPNIAKLIDSGASCAYSSYAQKGYNCSYLSETNWATIYTGLDPEKHNIAYPIKSGRLFHVTMNQFEGLKPFWELLNECGLTVGMWAAADCDDPVEVNGYVVSSNWRTIETPQIVRTMPRENQVCQKDAAIREMIPGTPPARLYPKLLSEQGYDYQELLKDEEKAWEAVEKYHFQDSIENFKDELDYYFEAMKKVQEANPVDVLYFYTPTTDLIPHCCLYCDDNDVLMKSYELLDDFVGKMLAEFEPDNIILMSDHGMVNFKELIQCSDAAVQKEAFVAREEVLWLRNGYIAFEGHNGSLLFTAHATKGTFIAAGKDIKHVELKEMRILDIYPTMLELFGIDIPAERNGYVVDIFSREIKNSKRLLNESKIEYTNIAIIQTHNPGIMDMVINEIFRKNRFSKITVVGEEKYREIFEGNQRVDRFVNFEEYDMNMYEQVYVGKYNSLTEEIGHIMVKK